MSHTIPLPVHRRADEVESAFDERIRALIEAAYADERTDPFHLGVLAYELFCTARPPLPMIPHLRPDLFLSFDEAQKLERIVRRALSSEPAEQFRSARAFGDALSEAFGPFLIAVGTSEELILFGRPLENAPFPTMIATDGVHAIDLLIEDPNRRLVLRASPEAIDLLDALRSCVLRRAPILIDGESARFPHPALVGHRPITGRDVELLRALCAVSTESRPFD